MTCTTNVCGTGGWSGPLPGDPDNNVTLSASPAFGGIDVVWSYPTINPNAVAHTLLYRGVTSNFSAATQIAVVAGSQYYDKIDSIELTTYFYWIKIVSVNGTIGALIGPAVSLSKPLVSEILTKLTQQIDESILAQSLKTRIDKIDLTAANLAQEISDRISVNVQLSNAIGGLQANVDGSLVLLNQEIIQRQDSFSAITNQLTTYGASLNNAHARITEETSTRTSTDSALSQSITTLDSQVNDPTTGLGVTRSTLINNYYTIAGTDSAISSATSTLVSSSALSTELAKYTTTALLDTNYYTKTDTDSAISSAVTGLASSTDLSTALEDYTTTADLETNYYTKTDADSAISTATTGMVTTSALTTALASYTTTAKLQDDYYTKTDADSAISTAITGLVSSTSLDTTLGSYVTTAALQSNYSTSSDTSTAITNAVKDLVSTTELSTELGSYVTSSYLTTNYKTKTDTESAITTAVTGLVSTTSLGTTLASYVTTAALTSDYQTKTDTASAISTAIETAQSSIGEDISSVQTTLQTNIDAVNNVLDAIYTVKVDVNGMVGGFGIYGTETEVEAGFDVDKFWIGRTNSNKTKPFMIVDDVVYMNNAMIKGLTADHIDTRGLSIKDTEGNVIFSAGNALDWSRVGGTNKPADGATRNVFVGDWAGGYAPTYGDIVMYNGNGWMFVSTETVGPFPPPPSTSTGVSVYWTLYTIKGNDGTQYYTWIKYSDYADGTGMYDTPTETTLYIGIAVNKTVQAEGTSPSDYVWSRFKGDQGIPGKGTDGVTYYTWIKYADDVSGTGLSNSPDGKTHIGFAYNKTSATESDVAADYAWSQIKGDKGDDGPSVTINPNRSAVFTSVDRVIDANQPDIVFTASVSNITSPTYVWTFTRNDGSGTTPTTSTGSTFTVTQANFGSSRAASVKCVVSGTYEDTYSVVLLDKSTAAAGATVGAEFGVNISGQITPSNVSTFIANATINTLKIAGNSVTVPISKTFTNQGIVDLYPVQSGYVLANLGQYDSNTITETTTRIHINVTMPTVYEHFEKYTVNSNTGWNSYKARILRFEYALDGTRLTTYTSNQWGEITITGEGSVIDEWTVTPESTLSTAYGNIFEQIVTRSFATVDETAKPTNRIWIYFLNLFNVHSSSGGSLIFGTGKFNSLTMAVKR